MIFETEREFEEALIGVLQQHGWKDGILRYRTEDELIQNWADILFKNNAGIDRLNGVPLTQTERQQLIDKIWELRSPYALNSFINGKTVSIVRDNPEDELHLDKEVSLKIFDRNEIASGSSCYQIAQQPKYSAHTDILNDRRGDVCLLINGMPLIHIELKKSNIPVSQATGQIEKYAHEGVFTGLFALVQVFVAMNPDDAVYFANPGSADFNPSYYFHWADFNNDPICAGEKPGTDEWKHFAATLLSIPMAHQLIGFYTIADSADNSLKVMRSYQYYAASAISDKVRKCKWEEPASMSVPGRLGGYIWHTTGSGKTMTSFKSAQLIADSRDADKVIFLMDRIELGTQSLKEYQAFSSNPDDIQDTDDTDALRAKLLNTDPQNTLIVTSIQKMSRVKVGYGNVTQAELDKLNKQRIVFIIDECHRSTFGDMLQDIRHSFPGALLFGFTGTPIMDKNEKKGATTSMIFGDCLHRYSIADGIRDGNVLGFDPYMVCTFEDNEVREAVALEKSKAQSVEEALSDPEKAKVFYYYMDSNNVPMVDTITKTGNRIKGIESYLKPVQYGDTTPHKDKVIEDILKKFPVLSHGNKFHALLATSSIPDAISYYRRFKEQAPDMHITALFDPTIDNAAGSEVKEDALVEIINDYNNMYGKSYTIPSWPSMKKDISARLAHKTPYETVDKNRDQRIDILIVVDQMLTGFDSKWLNTLYLDKVIEYESIIQAFSRTNRIFGPEKPFGVIRYYRKPHTMTRNIAEAVELYSGDRPLDLFVQRLPKNIAHMDEKFEEILYIFEAEGVGDLSALPESTDACAKFAKDFIELNGYLEAACVQGFRWDQREYCFERDDGTEYVVCPVIDVETYLILVLRYKELFKRGTGPESPDVPYDLDGHLTEIDTGLIDTDYMNANFKKWKKALETGESIDAATEELHRSFAFLSQEEQVYAELFLHDVERGDITLDDAMTFRDYITAYAHKEKEEQVDKIVNALGIDHNLLTEMMALDLTEANINEYGRFDSLMDTIDKQKAKAYFEAKRGQTMTMFKVNSAANDLLRRFILEGGFNIDA